jgi:hypothetical protein
MTTVNKTYLPAPRSLQPPFDVAVVIPTVLRATLTRAVESVYRQRFSGTIQILLGIDHMRGDVSVLGEIERDCPAHCVLSVLDLGYSTSTWHGGLHPVSCGGALRTILSYAANSRRIAYLDDDNWWGEDHLQTLGEALHQRDWAYSLRWYVDQKTGTPLCIDEWESVGPNAGIFKDRFGGFVDTNCLMIDKLACEPVLRWWSLPLRGEPHGYGEDRNVFHYLKQHHKWGSTGRATSYYVIKPSDAMHPARLKWSKEKTTAAAQAS